MKKSEEYKKPTKRIRHEKNVIRIKESMNSWAFKKEPVRILYYKKQPHKTVLFIKTVIPYNPT